MLLKLLWGSKARLCANDNWLSERELLWKMPYRINFFQEATHRGENTVMVCKNSGIYIIFIKFTSTQFVKLSHVHEFHFLTNGHIQVSLHACYRLFGAILYITTVWNSQLGSKTAQNKNNTNTKTTNKKNKFCLCWLINMFYLVFFSLKEQRGV